MKKIWRKLRIILAVAVAVILIVGIVVGYGLYIKKIGSALGDDSLSMLNSVSTQGAQYVFERIENNVKNDLVRADAINSLGDFNSDATHNFVVATCNSDVRSSRVILTDKDGISFSSDGISGNLAGNENIVRALSGEPALSKVDSESLSPDENVVMVSVPVKAADGNVRGVLSCVYTASVYGEIMDINSLNASGRYCVVDSNARFIMQHSEIQGPQITPENITATEEEISKMIEDMKAGKDGVIMSKSDKADADYVSYTSVGVNDWFLISLVSRDGITGKTVGTYKLVVSVTTFICLALVGLFIIAAIIEVRMRRQLAHRANYDGLTDIPNEYKLREFFEFLPNKGNGYIYLHLNIDNLEQAINIFGYETGNNILKAVASTVDNCVGEKEIAARLRDDSFGLLLKFSDDAGLSARLSKIMTKLDMVTATDGNTVFAFSNTYSCGIYSITGNEAGFDDISNMARFTAKLINKQTSVISGYANDQMQESLKLRNRLLSEAETALKEKQIVAYMQPKYDIKTKKITAAETFARWNHPELGIIQPAEFLSVLELSGQILTLDLYMFEEACKLMKKWIDEEQMPVPLAVNISPFNFYEISFVDKIMEIVKQNNVPTCLMNLEIDQKALMTHQEKAEEIMNTFHDKGFILSVDNFGGTSAPLDIFYHYPIDILNFSPIFIQKARDDEDVKRVFAAVVSIAKEMKIILSAEAVELQEQEDFLVSMSCEMVQGYFYSIPQPREEFEKMIFSE